MHSPWQKAARKDTQGRTRCLRFAFGGRVPNVGWQVLGVGGASEQPALTVVPDHCQAKRDPLSRERGHPLHLPRPQNCPWSSPFQPGRLLGAARALHWLKGPWAARL